MIKPREQALIQPQSKSLAYGLNHLVPHFCQWVVSSVTSMLRERRGFQTEYIWFCVNPQNPQHF
jgi:hypothetical protein